MYIDERCTIKDCENKTKQLWGGFGTWHPNEDNPHKVWYCSKHHKEAPGRICGMPDCQERHDALYWHGTNTYYCYECAAKLEMELLDHEVKGWLDFKLFEYRMYNSHPYDEGHEYKIDRALDR